MLDRDSSVRARTRRHCVTVDAGDRDGMIWTGHGCDFGS